MAKRQIKSALISVFHKDGLGPIVQELKRLGVTIYSTGGTQSFIEKEGAEVVAVETLTSYPSILDGRVKTLHPKVHGGILARREKSHLDQLAKYEIPEIDLVVVDLYPFEETVASTDDEEAIIEKIDIGGIALIRAAAKNYNDVHIVPSQASYGTLLSLLKDKGGVSELEDRKALAMEAFKVSSHYDTAIFKYFNRSFGHAEFKHSVLDHEVLRYGENPHQSAHFHGDFSEMFDILGGKALSFNNLVDVDGAVNIMAEFKDAAPTFAVLKHTNACGVATRPTVLEAWKDALAGDPVSAFGGILITNTKLDLATAEEIDKLFYEVLIAPEYDQDALDLLLKKKTRRILVIKHFNIQKRSFKTVLNGVVEQDTDIMTESVDQFEQMTTKAPTAEEAEALLFAIKCVKHLKSNSVALIKDQQLIGMGCGQTSRVDALRQAILKAKAFGFDTAGSVMASEAFFPFPDCVDIAHEAGIVAVVQPGGSKNDYLSIDACNEHGMAMVKTGIRHFKH